MTVSLGYVPETLVVHLTSYADFTGTLRTKDGSDWPVGTAATLTLTSQGETPAVWPATVAGPTITWNADKAVVAALGGPGTQWRAQVAYTDGGTVDIAWMRGTVAWHG